MTILLNILGVVIFYLVRYANRAKKTKFDFKFWIKENWIEVVVTLLINVGVLIILLNPLTDPTEFLQNYLPSGLAVAGKPAGGFLLGLFFAFFIYEWINKKIGKGE